MHPVSLLLLGTTCPALLSPYLGAQPPCRDLDEVTAIGNDILTQVPGTGGLSIQIDQHGQNLYRQAFGSHTPQTVVALASATKAISAAVLMSLVDDGIVGLDDPIAAYLPEYASPPLDQITLRMCFAHTSGFGNSGWTNSGSVTLRVAAQQIAGEIRHFAPGTGFYYGNASMQVAGAACEVASGQSWNQLFAQRVAAPLGLVATDYGNSSPSNPKIAGGGRSNLLEYARVFDMLRNHGSWNGTAVLSPAAVDEMFADHTSGLPATFTPNPHGAPYGLGLWIDRQDAAGRTTHVSSPGFWGFMGFVDRVHDATGVLSTYSNGQLVWPHFERLVAATDRALLPIGCACAGASSPACADALWLNATTWPRAGQNDFAFRLDRAPANAIGALFVAAAVAPHATTVLGLESWLALPTSGSVPVASDALGSCSVAAPLTGVPAGRSFAAQGIWLDAASCGAAGLRASHAVQFTVLVP